jgi:vacuolar protein sorting-associated protein 26
MSFFSFGASGSSCTASISLDGVEERKKVKVAKIKTKGTEMLPLYAAMEPISGQVSIDIQPGKKVEHGGVKIEAIGSLQLYGENGAVKDKVRFSYLVKELRSAGTLFQSEKHAFSFDVVERIHETYRGRCIALRYFLRVTVTKTYGNTVEEIDYAVENSPVAQIANVPNDPQEGIRMEVGIEDCLHIEFEFDKSKYSLKDVILGKIHFVLVRIKIKHMEVAILRRENAKLGSNVFSNSENMTKFELMDGAPIKGESIPVRLFLAPLDLSPTYRTIANCASIKYYLNLVLIDEEDRRYFKQHEVTFFRGDGEGQASAASLSPVASF